MRLSNELTTSLALVTVLSFVRLLAATSGAANEAPETNHHLKQAQKDAGQKVSTSSTRQPNKSIAEVHKEQAKIYLSKGELEKAIEDYSKCLQLTPHDLDALYNRGFAYAQRRQLNLAWRDYKSVVELLSGKDLETKQKYADAYCDGAQFDEAHERYQQAGSEMKEFLHLRSVIAAYREATAERIFSEAGLYKDAILCGTKYIFRSQVHSSAFATRSLCYAAIGDYSHSVSDVAETLRLNFGRSDLTAPTPPCSEKTLQVFQVRFAQGSAKSPKEAGAHFAQALVALLQKQYSQARAESTKALQLRPSFWEAYNLRALCLMSIGQQKTQCLSDLNKAIEINPHALINYVALERFYSEQGHFEEVLPDLAQRSAKSPGNDVIKLAQANAYRRVNDDQNALKAYAEALTINPRFGEALLARGRLYEELGESAKAIADFTRHIESEPTNAEPYRDRASCYFDLKDYSRAVIDLSKVIDLAQDLDAYAIRGECYRRLGKLDLAKRDKEICAKTQ